MAERYKDLNKVVYFTLRVKKDPMICREKRLISLLFGTKMHEICAKKNEDSYWDVKHYPCERLHDADFISAARECAKYSVRNLAKGAEFFGELMQFARIYKCIDNNSPLSAYEKFFQMIRKEYNNTLKKLLSEKYSSEKSDTN